jgi:CysZ protein
MIITLKKSLTYLLKDKVNFTLASFPVLVGIALYAFLGRFAFTRGLDYARELINSNLTKGSFADIIYYLLVGVITVALFFLINWTFVLLISIIASPFNDLISKRVAKAEQGLEPIGLGEGFSFMFKNLIKTLLNEIKKVCLIVGLTILAVIASYIPFLTPLSLLLTALLLAAQFADYNWSRHNLTVSQCIGDMRRNFFGYSLSGAVFLFLISVPLVNIFIAPLATAYYAIIWVKNEPARGLAS